MPTKLLTFILLLIIFFITINGKPITVTCAPVPTTQCNSGYAYKLNGNGYSDLICTPYGQPCIATLNEVINVVPCTRDYTSNYCNSTLCFSIDSKPIDLADLSCSLTLNQSFTCGSCSSCIGKYCRQTTKSNFTSSSSTVDCVDGCPTPNVNNLTIGYCNGDIFGTSKSGCCGTFSTSGSKVCTLQSSFFSPLSSTSLNNLIKWASSYHFTAILFYMIALSLVLKLF